MHRFIVLSTLGWLAACGGKAARAPVAPPTPTGLVASAGDTQVALTWRASAGATSYAVKRSAVLDGPYVYVGRASSPSFVDRGLDNDATYYYAVSARNGVGESPDSTPASATLAVHATSITLQVAPSRTTGVAPLAVFFDASATTGLAGNDFLQAHFTWDFDDAGAGAWPSTGLDRSSATGFLAAHVFETPGTYVVTVGVRDRNGRVGAPATVTITVSDPETAYSATATRCVSRAGSFTGAPPGCEAVTSTDLATQLAWLNGAADRRLLLRRGETWTGVTVSLTGDGPNTLGAFGPGERPILVLGTSAGQEAGFSVSGSDWRVLDLELDGSALPPGNVEGATMAGVGGTEVLAARLYLHGGHAVGWGSGGDQTYLYDSTVVDTGYFSVYVDGVDNAVMGSTVDQMRVAVSFLRPTESRGFYIAHNLIDASRAAPTTGIKWHSRRGVITDNLVTAGTSRISLTSSDVACDFTTWDVDRDLGVVLLERNRLQPDGNPANDTYTGTGVDIGEDEVVVRNNLLFDMSLGFQAMCGSSHVHVLNNTVYMTPTTVGLNVGNGDFLNVDPPDVAAWEVRNNLVASENPGTNGCGDLINLASPTGISLGNNVYYKPLAPEPFGIGSQAAPTLHDLDAWQALGLDAGSLVADPLLVSVDPASPDFLRLGAGSPAIGAGTPVAVFEDFHRASRPSADGYDAGAISFR